MTLNRIQNEVQAIQENLKSFLFQCSRASSQTCLLKLNNGFVSTCSMLKQSFSHKISCVVISSVISRKRTNLKTGVSRKQSTPIFPKNEHFFRLVSFICSFSGNMACFVFLKNPLWDLPFCLITDDFTYFESNGSWSQENCIHLFNLKKKEF